MDGRRPRGMMFAPSGADPALPVGGATMSEPQGGGERISVSGDLGQHLVLVTAQLVPEGAEVVGPSGAQADDQPGGAGIDETLDPGDLCLPIGVGAAGPGR